MAHKSKILEKICIFKAEVENLTGQKIQTLQSDNGGEYTSAAFNSFLEEAGIIRQFTKSYKPHQIGIAERCNRSLLDLIRCLLLSKQFLGALWGKAVRAATIILNLRSSEANPDKTPDKMFFGKKPTVSNLQIFGSLVYVHTLSVNRSKLNSRSKRCVLLSYDSKLKGYRCYSLIGKQVLISGDVRILEMEQPEFPSTSTVEPILQQNSPSPSRKTDTLLTHLASSQPKSKFCSSSPIT